MRAEIRYCFFFFFQAEDGIRDLTVTGVQTCALPIYRGMSFVERLVKMIQRLATRPWLLHRMHELGISWYPPNYVFFDTLGPSSIVADVGCGYEAEFSRHMIDAHGLRAVGVDPTRKHALFLSELEKSSQGRFTHLP